MEPLIKKERCACPFYGFYYNLGIMLDQKGNQCALITSSYSPCQMEIRARASDWNECFFNVEEVHKKLEGITKNMRVFPEEFYPNNSDSWSGISFEEWKDYVMKKK